MTEAANNGGNFIDSLAERFAGVLAQSRHDLLHLSNLHHDFVRVALAAIDAPKGLTSPQRPGSGEIVPHLVLEGLKLADNDRRMLAAAWLSLFGYMCIVDHELDQKGYLNAQSSIAASALLGWGVATLGRFTAGTPFADVFLDNINRAFAGQYRDLSVRGDVSSDRLRSDSDKNRALVAAIAGFCASAGMQDDHLIRSAEQVLGTFQILDDLQDLQEDYGEDNATIFVRIAKECAATVEPLTRSAMYKAVIHDSRSKDAMLQATDGIDKALLMLDANRDQLLITFFSELRERTTGVIEALEAVQRAPSAENEHLAVDRIGRVFMSSAS